MSAHDALQPETIRLVKQEHRDTCGIACAAMIVGASYREALAHLSPPPSMPSLLEAYGEREERFFQERGWWASAQLLLKTLVDLDTVDAIIEEEKAFREAVEGSQRIRLVVVLPDGTKPDHVVIWDKDLQDRIYDPAVGVVPTSTLFDTVNPYGYKGSIGFTAFCFSPGKPIKTLIKTELGV